MRVFEETECEYITAYVSRFSRLIFFAFLNYGFSVWLAVDRQILKVSGLYIVLFVPPQLRTRAIWEEVQNQVALYLFNLLYC